ncbi:hypothetical protein A2U01_0065016, partial [Trifolium medium]|nr:hypothetical protein [Trifolium medium]
MVVLRLVLEENVMEQLMKNWVGTLRWWKESTVEFVWETWQLASISELKLKVQLNQMR